MVECAAGEALAEIMDLAGDSRVGIASGFDVDGELGLSRV